MVDDRIDDAPLMCDDDVVNACQRMETKKKRRKCNKNVTSPTWTY